MKKSELRQIIREEISKVLKEEEDIDYDVLYGLFDAYDNSFSREDFNIGEHKRKFPNTQNLPNGSYSIDIEDPGISNEEVKFKIDGDSIFMEFDYRIEETKKEKM